MLAEFDPLLFPELAESSCPYLGLEPFSESDSARVFGRERAIKEMIRTLGKKRLLAIVGPSGSGKSSLVLAGLLPELQAGALPGSEHWRYVQTFVPGSEPLRALALAVMPPHEDPTTWIQATSQEFLASSNTLRNLLERTERRPVVLIVDQFEEILPSAIGAGRFLVAFLR